MINLLARKLEHYAHLSPEDVAALDRIALTGNRLARAHQDLIGEGERPRVVNLILEGWACRYKVLEDGRRQLMALFLPGDMCDLNIFVLRTMDHSIGALTPLRYAEISRKSLNGLMEDHPRIAQALWWELLVAAAVQREWTVNLGQRSAIERIAHLLCELYFRMDAVGLVEKGAFRCPLTQGDVADTTGMTPVHVNRTVQELRVRGLIEWKERRVLIPDIDALSRLGFFNIDYLHLNHEGAQIDSSE